MTNMKTGMNHNLLTQMFENIRRMEYYEQTVKFMARFIEDLRKNTTEKGASFTPRGFLKKGLKCFERKGLNALTKDM